MIKKVLNITRVKQDLLRLVASGEDEIVITRDYEPVGMLIPSAPQMDHAAPVLMVLGAKPCRPEIREACFAALRETAGTGFRELFLSTVSRLRGILILLPTWISGRWRPRRRSSRLLPS